VTTFRREISSGRGGVRGAAGTGPPVEVAFGKHKNERESKRCEGNEGFFCCGVVPGERPQIHPKVIKSSPEILRPRSPIVVVGRGAVGAVQVRRAWVTAASTSAGIPSVRSATRPSTSIDGGRGAALGLCEGHGVGGG